MRDGTTPGQRADGGGRTLDDWAEHDAIPFDPGSSASLDAAVDGLVHALGWRVALLGLGEALHGVEALLRLRNGIFRRLVAAHGFSAIAVESSFPRARIVMDYVEGRGRASLEEVLESGFSHEFGRSTANRALVEWMREYNDDPAQRVKLRFYGFDSPTEMTHTDSPRALLAFVLDYLESFGSSERREEIERLLGDDAAWENPAAMMDPAQSIGRSPEAAALRIETEDLIEDLAIRRPELVGMDGEERYREAVFHARMARRLLNYHAALAAKTGARERLTKGLGMRDSMMADNLLYILSRERRRGRVLAFAHNSHLQRGRASWQLGPHLLTWWPAGAQLASSLGERYAVVGSGIGSSASGGIGVPEAGTLEAVLAAVPAPALFIPTARARGAAADATIPVRPRSAANSTYFPLTPRSLADFDSLAFLDATP